MDDYKFLKLVKYYDITVKGVTLLRVLELR